MQSKLTFNGIQQSYETFESYLIKQNQVLMDNPIYSGFAVLEVSKLLLYEIYYDELQPYFGEDNTQLHYMDGDSFVLSIRTHNIIKDLKNLEHLFDFSDLDDIHKNIKEQKQNSSMKI